MSAPAKTNQEKKGSNWQFLKWSLGLLVMTLVVAGAAVGILVDKVSIGVLIFVSAFIPLALVSYLETHDKMISWVLIFVAVLAASRLEVGLLLVSP